MKNNKWFSKIFITLVLLFTYIPLISMIVFSFNDSRNLTKWEGFTFRWYIELFTDNEILIPVIVTLVVAIISTIISTIIGTLAALSLTKNRKVVRKALLTANDIPILNPEIVTAIAMFLLFIAFGIERGYLAMLLAHIGFSVPYVVVTVYPKVLSLDPNLADASADLGATPLKTLFKVILPQIKASVIAGAAIAFTMSFDDFAISYFSTLHSGVKNISIYLYTLKRGIKPTVNALSTIIIVIILGYSVIKYLKVKKELSKEGE